MKDAKTSLMEVLAAIPDGMRLQLFLPMTVRWSSHYLYSLCIERRYQGHAAIRGFYDLVKQLNPDFAFKPEDTHVLIETPDQVFAEYIAHTTGAATSRLIHHLFAARLVAEHGKIKLLRESLNVIAAAQALNPNGVAALQGVSTEINSTSPEYRS
jgi:uncharacterized protein